VISATKLFELISSKRGFRHERYEIASTGFGNLRRSVGGIIRRLSPSEDIDAVEIANAMRIFVFSWLTAPVKFDLSIRESLNSFGTADEFDARWGTQGDFKKSVLSAEKMVSEGNPLREKLVEALTELHQQGKDFKIFCHPKARPHFDSLNLPWLTQSFFFHSVRDYARAESFHALVKIGPLRSRGWGAAPDAIQTAPKFDLLIQLVWSGCADDPKFGYDPVEPPVLDDKPSTSQSGDALRNQIAWKKQDFRVGHDSGLAQVYSAEQDEFSSFAEPNQQGSRRRATLLEISASDGILYPPTANILSFDGNLDDTECLDLRIPRESLTEGMFIVQTHLGKIDFGANQAQEGGFSRIWKSRLREELKANPDSFCLILRNKGLSLLNLRSCVAYWAQPPGAVIHAPLQKKHFQILVEALAIDPAIIKPSSLDARPWWQRAWDEVRVSRGEAIQTGRHGQEIIEQQAMQLLKLLLPEVRRKAANLDGFRLQIPFGQELEGAFAFFKILRMEDGYLAPETEIKFVRDLIHLEQWKVA
jgi:hypothetical protein